MTTYDQEHFVEPSTLFSSGARQREMVTYSDLSAFRNCRRKYYWRSVRGLVPVTHEADALWFGDIFHRALEEWHKHKDNLARDAIDKAFATPADDIVRANFCRLHAMLSAYGTAYPHENEDFEVVALEQEFRAEIHNPVTGAKSRSFILGGKVDGIVRCADGLWLFEHKTASETAVTRNYIDRLALDFQVQIYTAVISRLLKEPVQGVIYNVICKPSIRPLEVNSRRKVAETEQEYLQRCVEWFERVDGNDDDHTTRLLRVPLYVDAGQHAILQEELWELTQQLLFARQRDHWYQNTTQCFLYNQPCPYFAICTSKDNPLVVENQYVSKAPHSELTGETSGSASALENAVNQTNTFVKPVF